MTKYTEKISELSKDLVKFSNIIEETKKIEELHNFDYNFSIDYDISSNIKYQEELSEMKDDFYFAA